MMNNMTMECPYCGDKRFIEAIQDGYANIRGESSWSGSVVCHTVCLKCGTIVRSYAKNPERLLKKKNRIS